MTLLLLLQTTFISVAHAQQTADALDLQPPEIQLDEQTQGRAGEQQLFSATVTDDREVAAVVLFYRFGGDTEFSRMLMLTTGSGNQYTATVSPDGETQGTIEYYIQAEDAGGNRAIKGFVFDPLVRQLTTTDQSSVKSAVTEGGTEESGSRGWIWAVAGLVVLGIIAGAASSGDDDSPPATGGPITINVNQVQ